MWRLLSAVLTIVTFNFSGSYCALSGRDIVYSVQGTNDQCKDEGVWILDGTIDCKYLHTKGIWGIDTEAKQRCTSDLNTKCCQTCRNLGFNKGSSGPLPETPTYVPPSQALPTQTPVTEASPGTNVTPNSQAGDQCKDEGIWILDGLIECKYLYIKGVWGVNTEAKQRCTSDANTNCCKTCRRLGFTAGVTTDTGTATPSTETPTTPTSSPGTTTPALSTQAPTTQTPSGGNTSAPIDPSCKDNRVWIIDMSVECKYLEQNSMYGLHSKPEYYCLNYSLTDCCESCARLGYRKGSNQTSSTERTISTTASTISTTAATTAAAKPGLPTCRNIGIMTKYGLLSCKYLEKKSFYRIHENPLQYCRNPWTTWCCETCARIQGRKPSQFYEILFGLKTPEINLKGISNQIV